MIPLAERLRPKNLEEYIGQRHLIGAGKPLRRNIEQQHLPSMILWGPPGVGKTTLARILANNMQRPFYSLSAISSGVKDVRAVIEKVKNQGLFGGNNAILFIDEIHRFSKSQQDALLGAVEQGLVTLIGATTENPSFEVIPALLSRCQVYVLAPLAREDLEALLQRSLVEDSDLKKRHIDLRETEALLRLSGGDARKLLNTLELVVGSQAEDPVVIDNALVQSAVQANPARYDKTGEQHYDIASALIKSIRGSNPDAAVYWLARMIEGGEDVKFIARRLLIAAAEDIGLANPTGLVMANNCFQAVSSIGYPEARIILSQCAIYLASSPKSNSAYAAINAAQKTVRQTGDLPVPVHLRNAPTKLMRDLGYGKEYLYPHDYTGNFVKQDYLPKAIRNKRFYEAGQNKREQQLQRFLQERWDKS